MAIKLSNVHDVSRLLNQLSTTFFLYKRLGTLIKEYAAADQRLREDAGWDLKCRREFIKVMEHEAEHNLLSDKLPTDELMAIAQCRLRKATIRIHDLLCKLQDDYQIQFTTIEG